MNRIEQVERLILGSVFISIIAFLIFISITTSINNGEVTQNNTQETNKVVLDDYSQAIYSLSNEYRTQNGIESLKLNSKLTQAAQNKADDLCNNNYWSHQLKDGEGFEIFVTETGYKYELLGENLGRKFNSPERLMNAWKGSESHNKNLLENYKETGIGFNWCGGLNITAVEFAR